MLCFAHKAAKRIILTNSIYSLRLINASSFQKIRKKEERKHLGRIIFFVRRSSL
jgi:hypothetical protein